MVGLEQLHRKIARGEKKRVAKPHFIVRPWLHIHLSVCLSRAASRGEIQRLAAAKSSKAALVKKKKNSRNRKNRKRFHPNFSFSPFPFPTPHLREETATPGGSVLGPQSLSACCVHGTYLVLVLNSVWKSHVIRCRAACREQTVWLGKYLLRPKLSAFLFRFPDSLQLLIPPGSPIQKHRSRRQLPDTLPCVCRN